MHMLSRKAFATNSLKQPFVWNVWFHSQIVCSKTQSTPNDSNSSVQIDQIKDCERSRARHYVIYQKTTTNISFQYGRSSIQLSIRLIHFSLLGKYLTTYSQTKNFPLYVWFQNAFEQSENRLGFSKTVHPTKKDQCVTRLKPSCTECDMFMDTLFAKYLPTTCVSKAFEF